MRLFNKVAIVGTGLIGGSLGLGLKRKKLCNQVIGTAFHAKTISLAKKIGAIDIGSINPKVIKDADLVILALPVAVILEVSPAISKIIKKEALVIDVGSTKKEITASLEKIFPNYLGAHPLAGSEKRGILNARADLFKDSLCLLTPTRNSAKFNLMKIEIMWKQLGARVFCISPDKHDQALSFISHLAHIAAFSLIAAIPDKFLKFSSSGLKDTTRIAASDSELWADIFLSNKKNIIDAIKLFEARISQIKQAIKKGDKKLLRSLILEAKNKRESL